MKITKPKLEAQEYLHSRVVRSVYVVTQVGYVWYHKMFVIQTKVDRLTMICTAKQKGKSFKYQNTETKIK